jgi:methionine aminopeptidase
VSIESQEQLEALQRVGRVVARTLEVVGREHTVVITRRRPLVLTAA